MSTRRDPMDIRQIVLRSLLAMPALTAVVMPAAASMHRFETIYDFCSRGRCKDGIEPYGLSKDQSGNLFGAALSKEGGVVFELRNGTDYQRLYRFPCDPKGQ